MPTTPSTRTTMHSSTRLQHETFGALVFKLRQRRQWSQRELARRAGLTPSVLSEAENAKRIPPCAGTVERISQALETSPEERQALSGAAERERLGLGLRVGKATPKHVAELLRYIASFGTELTPAQVRNIRQILEITMK